jgi:hypothetical protein
MGDLFFINLIKSFIVMGGFAVVFGVLCLIMVYIIDSRGIREEYSGFGTTLGNALFIIQSIFQPQSKVQTEQVIWVKKRRTPVERRIQGLSELQYDKLNIRGIKTLKNKRFYVKSGF